MTEPRTAAGRALLHFIDAAITNTTNGVSWRNGAGYARVCAEGSIPAIEAEARAAALDEARAAVEALDGVHVPMPPAQRGDHDYGLSDPKLVYADRALAAIDALREKR